MNKIVKIILIIAVIISIGFFLNWATERYLFDDYNSYREQLEEDEALLEQMKAEDSNIVCSSNYYNCANFSNYNEAKEVFDYCKGQGQGDIHYLDGDDDGIPCEALK